MTIAGTVAKTGLPLLMLLVTTSLMLSAVNAFAACKIQSEQPRFQIAVSKYANTQANSIPPYSIDTLKYHLNWQAEHWHAKHDYRVLNYPSVISVAPVTNGHLHTLGVGYRDERYFTTLGKLYWAVLPTLAVSSNFLRNPEQIRPKTLRIDGYLLWKYKTQDEHSVIAGLCNHALAGKHKLIPVVSLAQQYSDWQVSVGYPHSKITFQLNSGVTIYSDWSLAGNEWQVLDNNLQNPSKMTLISQRIRLGFQIQDPLHGVIEIYWSRFNNQQIDYLARDGMRKSVSIDDSNGWMIGYSYFL